MNGARPSEGQLESRAHIRALGTATVLLRYTADDAGVAAFEGWLVDASSAGIGFLDYDSGVTLERGTVLRRCRLEAERMPAVIVDLEVRYVVPVPCAGAKYARRFGCRFIDPPESVTEIITRFRLPSTNQHLGRYSPP